MPSLRSIPLTCVLFDLDGTLVKTHIDFNLIRRTVIDMANEAGAQISTEITSNILINARDAAASLGSERGPELYKAILLALEEIEMAGCAYHEEMPGALDLLARLRESGVKIGVVTRNCRRVSEMLLASRALPHNALLTRDDVVKTKPDPTHLHDAMALLNASPNQTAMVGDHWTDIQGGKSAGCVLTVGVLGSQDESWFDKCKPDLAVRDLAELLPHLT